MILSEQILNEALRLANDKGWRSAGVREISRELDISPGNLSYHFARKEEILKELLGRMYRTRDEWMEDLLLRGADIAAVMGLIHKLMLQDWEFRGLSEPRYNFYLRKNTLNPQDPFQDIEDDRLRLIFVSLSENGYLTLQEEDLDFLVSYTRMFLLCWMSERHGAAGENLRKGIYQFAQQLYYFTNDAGHSEINSYLEYLDD